MDPKTNSGQGSYDVFISYSQADVEAAASLAEQLRRRGRRVFVATDSVGTGANIKDVLTEAIFGAAAVLVLLSPEYAKSSWSRLEMELALERARLGETLVVPVWLPGVNPTTFPSELSRYRGVPLGSTEDFAAAVEAVDRSLSQRDRTSQFDQQQSALLLKESLADSERGLGPDHPSTVSTRANLANVYVQLGRTQEAAVLLERSLADSERVLGPDRQATLSTRANLANVYAQLGRTPEAAVMLEQSLAGSERVLGPDDPSTLSTRANLATIYLRLGRILEAAVLLEQSLADSERVLGPEHPSTLSTEANLATVYLQLGRAPEAAVMLEQSLAGSERVLGPDHPSTLSTEANLATVYLQLGRNPEAAMLLERASAESNRALGSVHELTKGISRLLDRARGSE
jgi:tetratricopeptide (TPR) repeat protein